ncbi:hypothetical protein [Petropleomorpha daqingensis]|uniref:DUF4267 domain-containing protein n=1 Tax=Petropleomorpha daqingensis TaxID=2026353 RepID=A0A853CN96_9ACTN|nr:hypothetical protein [Petropleomorpha daqingensis]NYJ07463.1 hypothetical protein [Petropleomorpha daqingensis]
MPVLTRSLGIATAAFGLLELAKPDLWSKPTGVVGPSPAMRAWHHTLGARDVASGLALLFAPQGAPLRAASVYRIASDLSDAVGFGLNAPDAGRRVKAVGAAVGFAALNALALRVDNR